MVWHLAAVVGRLRIGVKVNYFLVVGWDYVLIQNIQSTKVSGFGMSLLGSHASHQLIGVVGDASDKFLCRLQQILFQRHDVCFLVKSLVAVVFLSLSIEVKSGADPQDFPLKNLKFLHGCLGNGIPYRKAIGDDRSKKLLVDQEFRWLA